jgi:glycosyltransferase involved in cell wall biosynthesis
MMHPKLSVIMAVRNGERYIERAIGSILSQSFGDFEFIIINDASTDATEAICRGHAADDERIGILTNEVNLGLAASLNRGLRESRGAYIARMDADDSSRSNRFKRQLAFLEQHPAIGICGTAICCHFGRRRVVRRFYNDHERLAAQLLFQAGFSHPTVMIRREVFKDMGFWYNDNFLTTQDYELWSRIVGPIRAANLSDVLLDYYSHEGQATTAKYEQMLAMCSNVHARLVRRLIPDATEDDLALHLRIAIPHELMSVTELQIAEKWLLRLVEANDLKGLYDPTAMRAVIFDIWRTVCYGSVSNGWGVFRLFWQSSLVDYRRFGVPLAKLGMQAALASATRS